MKVEVSADCYARLAYGYYPLLAGQRRRKAGAAAADGRPLHGPAAWRQGEHVIAIEARLSPLRRGLLALGAVSVVVMALALVFREQRNNLTERCRTHLSPGKARSLTTFPSTSFSCSCP